MDETNKRVISRIPDFKKKELGDPVEQVKRVRVASHTYIHVWWRAARMAHLLVIVGEILWSWSDGGDNDDEAFNYKYRRHALEKSTTFWSRWSNDVSTS